MTGIPVANMTLLGIQGGGRTWVLDEGRAKLHENGRLQLKVKGLVLGADAGAAAGTNPIDTGVAIVVCDGGTSTITSTAVPFSDSGDARVNEHLTLPNPCLAPVVFFAGVTGAGPRWFAVTGG
jgi:hypothetical protein